MGATLVFSCFVISSVILSSAEKYSLFHRAADKRTASGILTSATTFSATHCTEKCLAAADCMACNWHEATRTCELLGAHATPVAAPGYTALTRFCKVTPIGLEFQGSLSMTPSGRTCQHWANDCDPHCHNLLATAVAAMVSGTVSPENYCRNPENDSRGPWCYTTDPNTRYEFCDVPFC